MASSLVSRNVTVAGHRSSMRLEPEMWDALAEICRRERLTKHDICTAVEAKRGASSLTAALRVFVMDYFRSAATEDGHVRSGHGPGIGVSLTGYGPSSTDGDGKALRTDPLPSRVGS
jgi:predicted DNA-binding ribbon-helix-helix protein